MIRGKEKGQTMAEFALVMPILILLMFGMTFAAFYAFRSAAADCGVFITGVASGSYNTPATEHARHNVLWPDLADRIHAGQSGPRQVRSLISVEDSRNWFFGIRLIEAQRAETHLVIICVTDWRSPGIETDVGKTGSAIFSRWA